HQILNNNTIIGYNEVEAWVKRKYFYAIELDQDFQKIDTLQKKSIEEKASRLLLSFNELPNQTLKVKVGMSTVSAEAALQAIKKENPKWDFEDTKNANKERWNNLLSRIEIEGPIEDKTNF